MNQESECIPRSLLRGKRAYLKMANFLAVEDPLQLAVGIFKPLSLSLLILLYLAGSGLAQSPCIQEVAIGEQKVGPDDSNTSCSSFRPIRSWLGERFVFLPKHKTLQKFGYRNFHIGDDLYKLPEYNEYVGRTAKVVSVREWCDHWDVEFEMEDNGERISAVAGVGGIDGIAPIADIESARAQWLGKTVWYKKAWLERYDEDTGAVRPVYLKKNARVKVVDIVAGWSHDEPVRFKLRTTDGRQGHTDIAWSGTNSCDYIRAHADTFETCFFADNPAHSGEAVYKPFARRSASLRCLDVDRALRSPSL